MIKQKTSSTFQKGLERDYNPLISEQNSLYDCLNGTFVTNDGDELILQNDMGNARVQKIKLDNGYVPVGMCDYGGVTYIASYNPITNKSQVGSFPSPQETFFSRTWGDEGRQNELCCTLGQESVTSTAVLEFVQQIFSTDEIIRPGDKFDIYVSDQNYYNKQLISNTDNIVRFDRNNNIIADNDTTTEVFKRKIKSPKNKDITISVCVADSSGNLHDITPTLKRYSITNQKVYDNKVIAPGDLIPFSEDSIEKSNTGTIFKPYPTSNNQSIVDNYDIEPGNIYNYKISGNLFLVYKINSLSSIEITAEFFKGPIKDLSKYISLSNDPIDKEEAGEVKDFELVVIFDVIYRYNCPDGYYDTEGDEHSTDTYHSLYGLAKDYSPDQMIIGIDTDILSSTDSGNWSGKTHANMQFYINSIDPVSIPTYNPDTNLYTSRQRYLLRKLNTRGFQRIQFDLLPAIKYGFLRSLKKTISVDTDKLNSGEVSISQWRYFVDDGGINISLGLETYPRLGTRLSNVSVSFYKLTGPKWSDDALENLVITKKLGEKTSYHGNTDIYLSFDEIEPGHIYCAIVSYKIVNIENNALVSDSVFYAGARILITTRLYNRIYSNSSILDFNKLDVQYDDKQTYYQYLHTYYPNILTNDYIISDDSKITNQGSSLNPEDDYIIEDSDNIKSAIVTRTKDVDITKRIEVSLGNIDNELYPFDIIEEDHIINNLIIGNDEELSIFSQDPTIIGEKEYSKSVLNDVKEESKLDLSISDAKKGDILINGKLLSKLEGKLISKDIIFSNAIVQYFPAFKDEESNYVQDQHYKLFGYTGTQHDYYIAYGITYRDLTGHLDHHGAKYIEVDLSKSTGTGTQFEKEQQKGRNIMIDLHSVIYGDSWNYPEVMQAADSAVKFNINDLITNYNFLKLIQDKTFVLFKSYGSSGDNNYKEEYVSGWVSLSRTEAGPQDKKVMNISNKALLFWKNGETLYLVARDPSGESYLPDEFQRVMRNIYLKTGDEIQFTEVPVISNSNSAYNKDYEATVNFEVEIIPSYQVSLPDTLVYIDDHNHTYNDILAERLNSLLNIDEDLLSISEEQELVKYTQFIFNKEKQVIDSSITINMEGLDDINNMVEKLNSGIYGDTVLIDSDDRLHTNDNLGNALLSSQAYEINDKLVYKFGTNDINKKIKNKIRIDNGKIVPDKTTLITKELISGGSGDTKTTLSLNGQPSIILTT